MGDTTSDYETIQYETSADKVATIRDFRHAAYVIDGADYLI